MSLSVLLPGRVLGDEFVKGADVSWLPQMEESGFTFRNDAGDKADCLQILKNHGMNAIRLRIWVNPSDDPRRGHCSAEEMATLAVRAQKMGYRIMVDFHYSDSWADPGKQNKPAAWEDLPFPELVTALEDHTRETLRIFKERGVVPEWVQLGNEISFGMLWPDGRASENPAQFAKLLAAGAGVVREADSGIRVVIQLDQGNNNGRYRRIFDALEKYEVDYDIIGMSYYPYWLKEKKDFHETIADFSENMADVTARYDKDVMLVETGGRDDQVDNTKAMLEEVLQRVRAVPGGRGLGVLYWEPQGARAWSGYPLSAWRKDGRPNRALDAFLETGAKR